MNKIERILAITVLLLDQEIISAKELANRFSVTKRTIFRDIQTMEYTGFPILSHTGRNGGFSLVPSFKLRTTTYDQRERQDILNALSVKEELFGKDQTIIKEKIAYHQKVAHALTDEQPTFSFRSPSMHRPEIENETREKMGQINHAIREKVKLNIKYIDNSGKSTQRVVQPYELMLSSGSWYVIAYCEQRCAIRQFKLTRIRVLTFLDSHYLNTVGLNKNKPARKTQKVHLKFKKEMLGKLYDFYTEEELIVGEEAIEIIANVDTDEAILSFLLMFGASVIVVQPEKLKQQHQLAIKKMTEIYAYHN